MPKPNWNKRYVAGKGDWRRGGPEEERRYRENYDRIFRKEDPEKEDRNERSEA